MRFPFHILATVAITVAAVVARHGGVLDGESFAMCQFFPAMGSAYSMLPNHTSFTGERKNQPIEEKHRRVFMHI